MTPRKRASPLVVILLAAALAALVALWLPPQKRALAASLPLSLLEGRTTTLAEFRGQPLLVTFWATDCAPCIEELPDLIALYRELKPRGLEILAVAMPYDPPLNVRNFVRARNVPYPVALDVEGQIVRAFDDVEFIPTSYLLNAEGRVVYRHVGKFDANAARHALVPLLPAAPAS